MSFSYQVHDNRLVITRNGREVGVLRGRYAARLEQRLAGATSDEVQQLLARASGHYRQGNERAGKQRRERP